MIRTLLGPSDVRLAACTARTWREGAAYEALPAALRGVALLADRGGAHVAVSDGNRTATLIGPTVRFADRDWHVAIKGVGATANLYGATPVDDVFGHELGTEDGLLPRTMVTGESWMGESPYGAQGEESARHGLRVTALGGADASIGGARIAPIAAVMEIPEERVRADVYWYRRHRGPVLQELRLVPSDVRLFHSDARALGREPLAVLDAFGVRDVGALDELIHRYLRSGLAAITIFARSARPTPDGRIEGLDYRDAWLDKDALIAPDGTVVLVDLESFDWHPTTHREDVAHRVTKQIDRNLYELLYGLDALLDVRDRWRERATDVKARRAETIARVGLAVVGDEHVRALERDDGLDLEIRVASLEDAPSVRVRLLDG
ncbi:MAG: hypothetical protein AB7S26_31890 [Sandaracinaceae bacterium]